MLDEKLLYRPARRRIAADSLPRNYSQREPFMYGSLLSDYMPRKRPTVHRERPLQECLVSTLVNRRRPPLPKERPITRSMVAEFLHKKREREMMHQPGQSFFGSRGGSTLTRRCKSAGGHRPDGDPAAPLRRISVTANGEKEFSMIQALIDEVLPKPKNDLPAGNKQKLEKVPRAQQKLVWKLKEDEQQQPVVNSPIASPPRAWPSRPASAPFKLSPQNMNPDDLAESLAAKRKNFLRKRPSTAPPPRPAFHLPLSRMMNPKRSSATPNPECPNINRKAVVRSPSASEQTSGASSSENDRSSVKETSISSSAADSPIEMSQSSEEILRPSPASSSSSPAEDEEDDEKSKSSSSSSSSSSEESSSASSSSSSTSSSDFSSEL